MICMHLISNQQMMTLWLEGIQLVDVGGVQLVAVVGVQLADVGGVQLVAQGCLHVVAEYLFLPEKLFQFFPEKSICMRRNNTNSICLNVGGQKKYYFDNPYSKQLTLLP